MTFGISAATAAIVGGGLAAAGSVAGAVIGSQGAQSAANTQANAQNTAAGNQMAMFNTITGNEQPYMQAGNNATGSLQSLLGLSTAAAPSGLANGYLNKVTGPFSFDPSSITSSPGYQFAQQQGLNAVANNEAPNVGALSGPALKALTQYSTGTAEQYYNDYFNQAQSQYSTNLNSQMEQQQNIFSRLSSIAGIGQNAASNTGTAGAALGTGAAQATAGAGASQAAGTIGSANALSGGLSGATNSLGGYTTLSSILNQNSSSSDPFAGTAQGSNGLTLNGGS